MMTRTPPMVDPTTTTIPTVTCLATKKVSDAPSKHHGRRNKSNHNRILPDDNINGFYNATTYNLVICNKLNTNLILTGDEENGAPNVLYDINKNNYYHATYQGITDNRYYDPPR